MSVNGKFIKISKILFLVLAIVLAGLIAIFAYQSANATTNNDYGDYVHGEVIACVETDSYDSIASTVVNSADENAVRDQVDSQMNEFLNKYNCETLMCATGDDAILNSLEVDAGKYAVKNLSSDNNKPAQMRFVKIKFDESAKSMSKMISELESLSVVKFAEPNYIASLQDADSSNQDPDFGNVQYAYDNEKTSAKGYAGMNVEGWNDSSTPNITSDKQAVVAVIDSGVDYNHPDIKSSNAFYGNMKDYSGLGGEYGYNATAEEGGDDTDPMDIVSNSIGHGTHCAGSIAAQWNSLGISGGAYDCSILPVRITSDDDSMQTSSIIKAFTYVTKTAQAGVNIKAINASWGGQQEMSFLPECVNLAGASGIISVFASGNDSLDCDQNIYSHYDLRNNPYAIIVNCSNCNGNMTSFSNFGVKTTDVFAPGDTIMSTIPSWTEEDKGKASLMISDTRFMTEGAEADYTKLDDFEDGHQTQLQYWEDEACQTPATTAGSSTSKKGYNSDKALSIPTSYSSPEVYITGEYSDISGGKNLTFLYNSDFEAGCTTDYLACEVYDLNTTDKTRLKRYNFSPCANTCPFGCMSVPVSSITPDANGNFKLKINFEYELSRNNKKRTNCYIDEVCLATTQRPYCFMSGTSMAAPACAGVTAVLACKYPNEDIKKIVARIKGGTNHKDSLKDYCYSGGIVDLTRSSSSNADTDLDPVVTSAEVIASSNNATTVKLRGYFLGDSSSAVTINGVNANSVVPGTDGDLNTLTCTFSEKIAGSVPVVVNKGGKTLTRYYELGTSEDVLERLPLPDKTEFSDFYSADSTNIVFSDSDHLLFQCNKGSDCAYYICDLQSLQWSRADLQSLLVNAFKDKGIDVNYVLYACGNNNNVYLSCYFKDGTNMSFKGFGVYSLSDDNIQTSIYRGPELSSVANAFVEEDLIYFVPGVSSQDLCSHNLDTEEYCRVATGLEWGTYPVNYKIEDGKYFLVDIANMSLNLYELTLDSESNGVTCQNLNQRAYPNITPGTGQTNAICYAVIDGQLMIIGPASFASGSVNVTADSYLRNVQTKEESAMSGLMSHEMVTNCSSARNSDYVFIFFKDAYGPALAKRYVGTPTPPTPDPTPGDNTAELVSAATGDATPVLVLFGVIAVATAILLFRKLAMRKYNLWNVKFR